MKRILFVCSLLMVFCTATFAQTSHPIPDPVSKPDFIVKVGQLNTLITDNNMTGAEAKWREIAQMINAEITVVHYKIQDATTDADKTHFQQLGASQRALYSQSLQLKNNMATNKAAINEKLTTFANTII